MCNVMFAPLGLLKRLNVEDTIVFKTFGTAARSSQINKEEKVKKLGKIIGIAMFSLSGIVMFAFFYTAMTKWLGGWGSLLSFILTPGIVIFPGIYWIVEKTLPLYYLITWGVGVVGLLIFAKSNDE